jgi:exopolysaccharide production protein ExoZ
MSFKALPKLELLQALRAIAALAVVFFHTSYQPGYGAYGVSIFFVLSGVIMAMLFESGESPGQFLQRRLIRIVPLYWCMTTLAAAITWLVPALRTSGNVGGVFEYIFSLSFIPFRANDGAIVPMLGPGWTINYEIAFYLTCVVGLFLSRHRPVVTTALLVFSWWYLACSFSGVAAEFYGRSLVLYFVAGMTVWQLSKVTSLRIQGRRYLILILLACSALAYLEFLSNHPQSTSLNEKFRAVFAIAVVTAGLFLEPAFQRFSSVGRAVLVEIGDASYAIYLSHIFVIHSLTIVARKLSIVDAGLGWALVSVLASTLVGILIHRYFDSPIQKRLRDYFRRPALAR